MNCPFCSNLLELISLSVYWGCYRCNHHLVVVKFSFVPSGDTTIPSHSTSMQLCYGDKTLALEWYEGTLDIWETYAPPMAEGDWILQEANIPICTPEEVPNLLKRIFANMI